MKNLLLTTALALFAAAPIAEAHGPLRLFVFGDSSADLGTFGPETRPTNQGEMWSERLARRVGLSSRSARSIGYDQDGALQIEALGGTSYAINGATALPFDGVFTLEDQVDFFVPDNGRFASEDLVFVWITRNDITSAAADGAPYDPQAYAQAFAGQIDRMRSLGARDIVSFGAETGLVSRQYALDLGVPAEALEDLRAATVASEAALWPLLAARDVFILDLDRLAEDVRANPSRYGFRFTTDSYQGRGEPNPQPSQAYQNDGNVFTLDGHYTTAMQAVVADFALAQLRGRELFLVSLDTIDGDFRIAAAAASPNGAQGLRASGSDWRWYGGLSVEAGRQDQNGRFGARYEDDGYGLRLGAAARLGDRSVVNLQLVAGKREGAFGQQAGGLDRESALLSAAIAHDVGGGFSVEGAVAGGLVRVDRFERRAAVGDVGQARARGATDGSHVSARAGARFGQQFGAWGVEAGIGLTVAETRLDAFEEQPGVLALSYGDAALESVRGDAHATIRYGDSDAFVRPYLSVRHQHDFQDDRLALDIGPTRTTRATWSVDRPSESATAVELGAAFRLTENTRIVTALSLDRTDNDAERSTFRVGLARGF